MVDGQQSVEAAKTRSRVRAPVVGNRRIGARRKIRVAEEIRRRASQPRPDKRASEYPFLPVRTGRENNRGGCKECATAGPMGGHRRDSAWNGDVGINRR